MYIYRVMQYNKEGTRLAIKFWCENKTLSHVNALINV